MGASGRGLLGPVSKQWEQRKSNKIKTNTVCGNTKTPATLSVRRPYPGPSLSASGSHISSWLDPGSLITPALCPGSAEKRLPSHPLETSLETLSAARGPRPRPTPALRWGRGKQLGNRGGLPGDPGPPLPAPPRGRPGPRPGPRRPARSHPDGELSRAPAVRSPRPPPQSGPGARSQGETHSARAPAGPARLSRSFLPALALVPTSPAPPIPLFLLGRPASRSPS
ncbi:proline-rich protein 2-like [Dama dama]|uniref:proline-rich protein 2-like n=1 Tax=Dama dama TaxID=30532 RepID=UPI002A3593BF|nr:proline-rich protein 2-like [Dama dama]